MKKMPRIRLLALVTASLVVPGPLAADESPAADGTTTVILVRHAEKDRSNPQDNDPRLTDAGHAQAAEQEAGQASADGDGAKDAA